ncbi:MAG: RNA polymerase sigma factor [Planctomycetes bacterium]|nr:RNA polymerase sigma factor [Planctomycetota bacterium]
MIERRLCADEDDRARMSAVRGGDRAAFSELVRDHQQNLVNLFRRLGADAHEAEDCAQETFLRVYRYRDRYEPTAPFRAFLHTLARHAWIDSRRRSRRRRTVSVELTPEIEPAKPADDASFGERLDLAAATLRLPDAQRWVLLLSAQQGLSYAEIAEILGVPIGTVKSRAFHAVRRLRELLHAQVEG